MNLHTTKDRFKWNPAFLAGFVLAFFIATLPAMAQQDQGTLPGYPVESAQQPADQSGSMPSNPPSPGPKQTTPPPAAPTPGPSNPQQAPSSLTLPVGSLITVRTNEWLSTDKNLPGDGFNAVLDQPIVSEGWVVASRGQAVLGRVSLSQKASHANHNVSQLWLQLSEMTLMDGQVLSIQTQLVQSADRSSNGARNAAVVGTTTGWRNRCH
jgi:hypothetical protein